MARQPWTTRLLVEDCKVLDISDIIHAKGFKESVREEEKGPTLSEAIRAMAQGEDFESPEPPMPSIDIAYSYVDPLTGERDDLDYKIRLTATEPHYGGRRFWFLCPIWIGDKPCQRRVGKLYRPPDERYYGCRHCYNLTYRSCRIHDKRIDALVRDPARLEAWMEGDKPRRSLLAIQAHRKLYP